jgi:hypothetical protein
MLFPATAGSRTADPEAPNNGRQVSNCRRAFSSVVHNPNSSLEKLDLSGNFNCNNHVVISFADSFANNSRLIELDLGVVPGYFSITTTKCAALAHILCTKSSIMSTYCSNHMLEIVSNYNSEFVFLEDLASLLRQNRENSKREAVCLKIIKIHFSGHDSNMQPFMDMDLSVRPDAIAWMARDESVYQIFRLVPL